jgi:RRXRR protein
MVFVLDKRKRPLMPCTEKRARLLLARGRAAVRASGYLRVGKADGVGWRHCQLLQRADGYEYEIGKEVAALVPGPSAGGARAAGLS